MGAARYGAAIACLGVAPLPFPAFAQYADGLSATLEAASQERRRGLGWSAGAPSLRAALSVPLTPGLSLDAGATSLWNSARHGGADAVIDTGIAHSRQLGAWRLSIEGRYHFFPGASGQDYGEIGGGAGLLIGPASVDVSAHYAPRQAAIGGDNLYIAASTAIGLPGTPFTLSARIGRSSGSVRDPVHAARLRPDGRYLDHGLGVDYVQSRWSVGLHYSDTDIAAAARHAGPTLIARFGVGL